MFLGVGLVWVARRSFWRTADTSPEPWLVVCLFFAVNYLFIVLFMNLNWERYYLPSIVAGRLLVAGGLCVVLREVYRRFRP